MSKENHYNPFTLGSTVYDVRKYTIPGTVTAITRGDVYPVKVRFADGEQETYTYSGRSYSEDQVPCLYTEPMTVVNLKTR